MTHKVASIQLLICILVCVFLFEMMEMFPADSSFSYSLYLFVPIVMLVGSVLYLIQNPCHISHEPMKYLIVYLVFAYLLSLMLGGYRTNAQYLTFIAPIFLYYVSCSAEKSVVDGNSYLKLLLVLFIALVCYYFLNFQKNYVLDFEYQDNAAYTILYFLPIILCIKQNYLKYIGILIGLIALIFSLKRGGLLAYAFSIIVYYAVNSILAKDKHSKFKVIAIALLSIGVIVYVFNYIDAISGNAITMRFQNIEEDQGSGRVEIWNWIFSRYDNNLFSFSTLFGHGWNAVFIDSGVRSAHNDFLEIFYDFGIIAVSVYIIFLYRLIKYAISLMKEKSEYAAPLISFITLIVTNSMVSHIIVYPKYMVIYSLVLGYIYTSSIKSSIL